MEAILFYFHVFYAIVVYFWYVFAVVVLFNLFVGYKTSKKINAELIFVCAVTTIVGFFPVLLLWNPFVPFFIFILPFWPFISAGLTITYFEKRYPKNDSSEILIAP